MKAIRSKTELLKKLKKNNLIHNGIRFELSDYHRTPVSASIAHKLINDGVVTKTKALSHWFEKEWKLDLSKSP